MRYWTSRRALAGAATASAVVIGVLVAVAPVTGAQASDERAIAHELPAAPTVEIAEPAPPEAEAEATVEATPTPVESVAPAPPPPPAPEPAPAPSTTEPRAPTTTTQPAERIMQCESGVEVAPDGTETSSATVEKVPADTPLAPGCHWLE